MSFYSGFAELYDLFMEEIDYKAWCRYVESIFDIYGIMPVKILDTACGTGNITIHMSKSGYDVWGLDISSDMLAVAENKARLEKQKIRFLNQDMTKMDLNEKFDAVLCMCDGVNYINDEEALNNYFKLVYERLADRGIFIFDISSYYKIKCILGNNTYYEEKNNRHYIWNNSYNEETDIVEMELIFFVPQDRLFRKYIEYHVQKAYKHEYLEKALQKAGFNEVNCYDGFRLVRPDARSKRIFFAARK